MRTLIYLLMLIYQSRLCLTRSLRTSRVIRRGTTELFDHATNPKRLLNKYMSRSFSWGSDSEQSSEDLSSVSSQVTLAPLKVMIFMDGSWLYYSFMQGRGADCPIRKKFGTDWLSDNCIDWINFQKVIESNLCSQIQAKYTRNRLVDIVRTYVFTSTRADTDKESDRKTLIEDFYKANFDVRCFVTKGAVEKCVDISLAVEMLYMATVPDGFDIAVIVTGDKDFIPALQKTRLKGKRTALCSMRNACSKDLSSRDNCLSDFDVIWIDDYLDNIVVSRTSKSPEALDSMFLRIIVQYLLGCPEKTCSMRDLGRLFQLTDNDGEPARRAFNRRHRSFIAFLEKYVDFFHLWEVSVAADDFVAQHAGFRDVRVKLLDNDEVTQLIRSIRSDDIDDANDVSDQTLDLGSQTVDNDGAGATDSMTEGERSKIIRIIEKRISMYDIMIELTVPQLKDVLRHMSLPVSGRKDELIERLMYNNVAVADLKEMFPDIENLQEKIARYISKGTTTGGLVETDSERVDGEGDEDDENGDEESISGAYKEQEENLTPSHLDGEDTGQWVLARIEKFVAEKGPVSSRDIGRFLGKEQLSGGAHNALDYVKRAEGSLVRFLSKHPRTFSIAKFENVRNEMYEFMISLKAEGQGP